jgi:hypothetical protein
MPVMWVLPILFGIVMFFGLFIYLIPIGLRRTVSNQKRGSDEASQSLQYGHAVR